MMENTRIRHFRYAAIDAKKHETLSKIEQAVRSMPANAQDRPPQPESPVLHRTHPTPPGMIQACVILDSLKTLPRDSPHGPRIRFATNSLEHILNCDAIDLLGIPLLSIVAQRDVTKASEFLQKLGTGTGIYFITLNLLRDPFVQVTDRQAAELVVVDIMGAGSDDGGILLCQPQTKPMRRHDSHYDTMSGDDFPASLLTDVISTDAETSGYDSAWNGLGIE
ncbi:hypothetical protein EC988_003508 [Linderina pennispora]|nr:hypothetical protein EC988_003508 [Linderina pennispora]